MHLWFRRPNSLRPHSRLKFDGSVIDTGAMRRDTRHLGHRPFWTGARRGIVVVLIASVLVWLSPSALLASVVPRSAAGHRAKPARRGTGTPDSWRRPAGQVHFFGGHVAPESEERAESAVQSEAPIVGRLPLLRSPHRRVISHIRNLSVQGRLSTLHSRALPLIC